MSYVNPIWLEGQRRRWTRHDAHRFGPPVPPKSFAARRIEEPRAAEEEAAAAAAQDAFERELLALRRELASIRLDYELRRFQRKYSPSQPRVPAGSREGGQWTKIGGGQPSASSSPTASARTRLADIGNRIDGTNQLTLSDASPDPIRPGTQQASVIRICMLGSHAISTDQSGNQKWWADYVCADGFTFRRFGTGGKIRPFDVDRR